MEGACAFCLHGLELCGDWHADQLERTALEGGKSGELGGAGTAGKDQGVAGEAGQLVEQGGEAVHGLAVALTFARNLGEGLG